MTRYSNSMRIRRTSRLIACLGMAMLAALCTVSSVQAKVFTIPETKEASLQLKIANYTFANIVRIAICETQAVAACDASVRMLSDFILITRGGTVLFASDSSSERGFVGITNPTIFRTEANGAFPNIVVPAIDNTGAQQQLVIAVTSDTNPAGSDTIEFLRVGNGPVPDVSAVPELATWSMMIVGFALVGLRLRNRSTVPA